jgi:predicted permease
MSSLRVTLRGLARTPVFTLVAVVSLALGIGANTAIFSLLNQVLLRTLPVRNPNELVFLYHPGPAEGSYSSDEPGAPSFSYPMFRDLQNEQTPFTGLAGARNMDVSLSYRNQAATGEARLVSGNYFEVLGVNPALGRVFTADDDGAPGAHPLAVLSFGYWTSHFGGAAGVLNQTILVNGFPMTIVGVAAKGFKSEKFGDAPDVFVPITMKQAITPDWTGLGDRSTYWVTLFGRLKPGVTLKRAALEINVAYRAELEKDIAALKNPQEKFLKQYRVKQIVLRPGSYGRGSLRDDARLPVLLLMSITALVLLIACANVANLQLARAAARQRELAVRLAIGASRRALIAQLLGESTILAVAGGAVGLFVAYATMRLIIAGLPADSGFSGVFSPQLDVRVLAFSLALSVASGIFFGIFPAIRGTKPALADSLKAQTGQTTSRASATLFRKSLTTVQMAISLLLLIGAGLLGKTLLNLTRIDLGLRSDHLLTFSLAPRLNQYSDQRARQFYEQLTDRLGAIPGVALVSASRLSSIAGDAASANITVEGYRPATDEDADTFVNEIGPDYFRTMGIPLMAGREFGVADGPGAAKVAIVNETFVRHFLPGANSALGHRLTLGGGTVKLDTEIVGVVSDAKYTSMRETPRAMLYLAQRQSRHVGDLHFYLRTATEPQTMESAVRRAVAALDANLPVRDMKTMDEQIEQNLYADRLVSILTAAFATLATLLAAVGLYGVMAYNIAQRAREIGIRMALGALPSEIRGMVGREVALMLVIGTVAGISAALASGRLVESILYGLKSWDPFVFVFATMVLWGTAMAAAWMPASRASRTDPMVALRYE